MAIQVSWGNLEKTFILYTFDGAWTWQEFHAANDIARRLASTVTHPVKEVIDWSAGDDLPSQGTLRLNVMSHVKSFIRYAHDTDCQVILVATKPLLKALLDTFRAISNPGMVSNLCFVKTMDEAYELLGITEAPAIAS